MHLKYNPIICYICTLIATFALTFLIASQGNKNLPPDIYVYIFIVLLLLCGPVSIWLSDERRILDPVCLFSIFGIHYFAIGPTFQYTNSYWPYLRWTDRHDLLVPFWYQTQLALLVMVFIAYILTPSSIKLNDFFKMKIRVAGVKSATLVSLILTGISAIGTYLYLGGFSGLFELYERRIGEGVTIYNPFAGIGPLVYLGDAAPLAISYFVLWRYRLAFQRSRLTGLVIFAIIVFASALFIAGLRGSRANTVYTVFIAIASYHFIVAPLRRWHIILGGICLVIFMQFYLAFKFGGIEAVFDPAKREAAYDSRHFGFDEASFVLVRDFTRMDVQVLAIDAVVNQEYPLALGRSIVGGVTAIIPSAIFPNRPETFVKEKSEIVNPGSTYSRVNATSLVFGFFGELFVNFHTAAVFIGVPLGIGIRLASNAIRHYRFLDVNLHLLPIGSILPIAILVYDSNSIMYFLVQFASIPILITLMVRSDARRAARNSNQSTHAYGGYPYEEV